MIEWSLAAFRACETVDAIVVAAPPGRAHNLDEDGLTVVPGGATRAQSVANALAAVETDFVAIHDAARPLLTPELVEDLVTLLESHSGAAGAIVAAPVTDTIKRVEEEGAETSAAFSIPGLKNAALAVARTEDRSLLWAAQTPQVFRTAALRNALAVDEATRAAATDEAMLVEVAGGRVLIHPTPGENLKVTTPLDLRVAELLLEERGA